MKTQSLITCLSILATLSGCNPDVRPNQKPETQESIPDNGVEDIVGPVTLNKRCIILFDISGSLGEEGNKRVSKSVYETIQQISDNSEIRVFAIDNNEYATPVFKFLKQIPSKPRAKLAYPQEVNNMSLIAADTVLKRCQTQINTSCIVKGFKTVSNSLNREVPAKQTCLLVLSDMLECCDAGCPQRPMDFKSLMNKIAKYQLNECQLATRIPLENVWIAPITGNPTQKNNTLQSSKEFKDFWTEIFKSMGYTEKPPFNQDLGAFFKYIQAGE